MTVSNPPETYKTFQKGQVIFREGQVNPMAYMVKKGAVLLYRLVNNRKVVIAHMKPGQIFGEMALITGEPSNATAEAEVTTDVITFDRIFLQSLLLKSPNPIQRMLRHLMEQLRTTHSLLRERPYEDLFLGICQLLELFVQAQGQAPPDESRSALKNAVSASDFSRATKTVLQVQQQEIDEVLDKLQGVNLIKIRDVKGATYKKDILGQLSKSMEYLRDQIIVITDPVRFMTAARNLRREMAVDDVPGGTHGLEYLDIHDLARRMGLSVPSVYRLICSRELPTGLLRFPTQAAERWMEGLDEAFFQVAADPLRQVGAGTVDEIVFEDSAHLQLAFANLGQRKVAVLFAAAGAPAKEKIRENISKQLRKDLAEECRGLRVELDELTAVEQELFRQLERIKREG